MRHGWIVGASIWTVLSLIGLVAGVIALSGSNSSPVGYRVLLIIGALIGIIVVWLLALWDKRRNKVDKDPFARVVPKLYDGCQIWVVHPSVTIAVPIYATQPGPNVITVYPARAGTSEEVFLVYFTDAGAAGATPVFLSQ